MSLLFEAGAVPESAPHLMTAIKVTEFPNSHCGLIVSFNDAKYVLIDFAWHRTVRCKQYENDYYCFEVGLDEANLTTVAAFAALVAATEPSGVNYGFDFAGLKFLPTGHLNENVNGKGLTCASFIYVLLNSLDIPPIDIVDWPVFADDLEWRKYIIRHLSSVADREHIEALSAKENGSVRVRPTQIVAAMGSSENIWPQHFEEISGSADNVAVIIS